MPRPSRGSLSLAVYYYYYYYYYRSTALLHITPATCPHTCMCKDVYHSCLAGSGLSPTHRSPVLPARCPATSSYGHRDHLHLIYFFDIWFYHMYLSRHLSFQQQQTYANTFNTRTGFLAHKKFWGIPGISSALISQSLILRPPQITFLRQSCKKYVLRLFFYYISLFFNSWPK